MLGIIGAMDVEVAAIKKKIADAVVTKIAGAEFVCGRIEDVMVCVAQCSPGKVNAALCTQAMIDKFVPEKIINIGVGCSLNSNVIIKNIVVATDVCQYDIDITALGEPKGFINGLNMIKIETDATLSEKLEIVLKRIDMTKKELAEKWQIKQPSISQKFKENNWKESDLKKFCEITGYTYEVILKDENGKEI